MTKLKSLFYGLMALLLTGPAFANSTPTLGTGLDNLNNSFSYVPRILSTGAIIIGMVCLVFIALTLYNQKNERGGGQSEWPLKNLIWYLLGCAVGLAGASASGMSMATLFGSTNSDAGDVWKPSGDGMK